MKKIISIVIILLLLSACSKGVTLITRNEAEDMLANGAILVDVRTSSEYEEGHIENAINIPLDSIDNINLDRDKNIIIYCATGVRSAEAAKKLVDMGYENIYNLDGGLLNWGDE